MADWTKTMQGPNMLAAIAEMEFMDRLALRHNEGCNRCKYYSTAWDTSYCTAGKKPEPGMKYCYGWEE